MANKITHCLAATILFFSQQLRFAACLTCLLLAGCQLNSQQIVASPLSYRDQEAEILKIAPEGTPREEAIEKLTAAGIQGELGGKRTIYYCDLWEREDGERWHLNVALLFNESGKVYKARPAQSETSVSSP